MTLEQLADGATPVALAAIGADRVLASQMQTQLGKLGLLDPPADGKFGVVSHWALQELLKRLGSANKQTVDAEVAEALLAADSSPLYPLHAPDTLGGRIVQAMQNGGYWINRHPECLNIIYIEGMDADGTPNDDAPNVFNDLRLLLRINRAGNPDIVDCWEATTEPGSYYTTVAKLDPRGAARIAFGQYKAWVMGTHNMGKASAHEALVQADNITVHRDLNEDYERNDATYTGIFGINQHWGFDLPRKDIGKASAGCLVGRTKAGHRAFMAALKGDLRYQANRGYRFVTTVMGAQSVAGSE